MTKFTEKMVQNNVMMRATFHGIVIIFKHNDVEVNLQSAFPHILCMQPYAMQFPQKRIEYNYLYLCLGDICLISHLHYVYHQFRVW